MRDSKIIGAGAIITTLAAGLVSYFAIAGGFGPSFDPAPHRATGRVMAEEALKLLKPGGEIIVIARDTTAFKNPATDAQMSSFQKTLSQAHAKIGHIHALQVDPLRPVEVPAGDFFELLRKCPAQDVIVSFMGPPLLNEPQRLQLGEVKPAIVAFCSGAIPEQVELQSLFAQGLLKAAIIAKRNVPVTAPASGSFRECFDRSFLVITPDNLGSLPTPQSASAP